MSGIWVFLHLSGVTVWLGGMFFATVCLHPTLQGLPGPERVKIVVPTLGRFFDWVTLAILLIWISGLAMVWAVMPGRLPLGWHLMIGAAVVMTLVFVHLRLVLYRRVQQAIATGDVQPVPGLLARIRRAVLLNLGLGVVAMAGVTLLR